jgi:hypothetical protein
MYTTIGTFYSFWKTVCCPGWIGIQSNQYNKESPKKNNKYKFFVNDQRDAQIHFYVLKAAAR